MLGRDMPLEQLRSYCGSRPCPEDFVSFWQNTAEQVKALDYAPERELQPLANPMADCWRITVTAADGIRLSAKYICPKGEGRVKTVLQFHDYPNASRGWFHLTRYISLGYAVLAPDCRGQGGESGCGAAGPGVTSYGPLFNGLEGDFCQTYLYRLYRDALLWARVAAELEKTECLFAYGEGQGAALALAACAFTPEIKKCGLHYPLLCDYTRVWELDYDTNAVYLGMNMLLRWHDPLGERLEEFLARLDYADALNFAPLVKAEVLMSTGLQDAVSPPSAQFALYNRLNTVKRHLVYPKHGHELNNFFENEWLKFLLS